MFVVCGEALMDVFAQASTATGMALDARVGGSPFNVAVGLARLSQPVGFFGAVSRDFLGERLMQGLRDEGVGTSATVRTEAPTTLSLIGTDAQGVPAYSFYGHGAADRQLGPDALARLPAALSGIHVGSYTTVVEPIASTLRALVERERTRTPISCDPNVRLNVEPDLARWRDMLAWMLRHAHLLKISLEDLELLQPGVDVQHFASEALANGVRLLVVTLGGDGARAWSGSATALVPAIAVDVIDTVGAGDSFQSALLTWLAEHGFLSIDALGALSAVQLQEALRFAALAAGITCSRRGANPPRRNELPG
jgi:fructokinase